MDFYDRINELLEEKKIKKTTLSKEIKIPYTTIASMFSRHSTSIDVQIIKKIADYLETTTEYLINGNENLKRKKDYKSYNENTIIAIKDDENANYYQLSENDFKAIITILEKLKGKNND